ncbi:hypothetical protein DSM3645_03148 [Blastopirellula marina DSM 3645]|uniref:Uncharacterized protein n=1 Tax=Blastopirellula marina DSM 3645 TaxID=314230 RepID=A3ZVU3_9BACT|nr:hypothetical protein DSM3645_03148 [Blastopirellula marina DSM 3645]
MTLMGSTYFQYLSLPLEGRQTGSTNSIDLYGTQKVASSRAGSIF